MYNFTDVSVCSTNNYLLPSFNYYLPPTDLATDPSLSTKEEASRRSRESATQPPTR